MLLLLLQLLLLQPLQPLPEGGKEEKARRLRGRLRALAGGVGPRGVFKAFSGELAFSLLMKPLYFL